MRIYFEWNFIWILTKNFDAFSPKDFSWDWFFIQINLKIYFETFFFRTTKQGLILTWNLKLTYGRSVLNEIFLLKTLKIFYGFLDKTCRLGHRFRSLFIFWTSSNLSFLTQKFRTQCQFRIEIKWSENSKVKVQMWRRIDFGIRWQLEFVLFFFSVEILNSKFLFLFSIIQWNYEFSFGNFWKKRFNNPVFIRLCNF